MTVDVNPETAAPRTEIYPDKGTVVRTVAERLLTVLVDEIHEHGTAHAALTGGGAGIAVLEQLRELAGTPGAEKPDWSKVHFWWGDERLLPAEDTERNAKQAAEALTEALVSDHGLPAENLHPMPSSEDAASPQVGAEMYAEQLAAFAEEGGRAGLALPRFAVILLGVGPDGHIASLFPGKESLGVTGRTTVAEEDSPKPPPARVSLTFDAIHTAERVWTVVSGEDKAEAAELAFQEGTTVEEIPAKNARGTAETVWHLDRAAASRL